jgi:hypothetical protein
LRVNFSTYGRLLRRILRHFFGAMSTLTGDRFLEVIVGGFQVVAVGKIG